MRLPKVCFMFYHNPGLRKMLQLAEFCIVEDVAAWRKCGNCVGSGDFFGRSLTKISGSRRLRIPQVKKCKIAIP